MRRIGIALLLALGLLQMTAEAFGASRLQGLAAATGASPAPRVFSSVRGLETYSTQFALVYDRTDGKRMRVPFDAELYRKVRGPYNRRNPYGAVLAYGPLMSTDPALQPMFAAVARHAVCGEAILLREIGIDPSKVMGPVRIELTPQTPPPRDLPLVLEVPCS